MTGGATTIITSYSELLAHFTSFQGILASLQSAANGIAAASQSLMPTGAEGGSLVSMAQMRNNFAAYETVLNKGFVDMQEFIAGLNKSLLAMQANDAESALITRNGFGHML